jgi:hypothetical protein
VLIATSQPEIGIPLGVIVGILAILVVVDGLRRAHRNGSSFGVGRASAVLTLCLTAPFATSLLKSVDMDRIAAPYLITLAVIFLLGLAFPTFRLIVALGNQIGGKDE